MIIGIVGVGMVGGTIAHGFRYIGHKVIEYDTKLNTPLTELLSCPLIFVCVPTPQAEDGSCDTSIVEDIVTSLSAYSYEGLVVIKSTITPGTTSRLSHEYQDLHIAYCPEFLRERAAYTDFIDEHDVCIVGAVTDADFELVKQAHGKLPWQFVKVTPLEAEFCKYFANVFNALRIIFANEFFDLCKIAGADYSKVKDAITKRRVIPDHYLTCNDQFRAFGGSCLPKDTSAFKHFASSQLSYKSIFDYIVEANDRIKKEP